MQDIHQLDQGDDNVLGRQCHIENTMHKLVRIMTTHDFGKQMSLGNTQQNKFKGRSKNQ